MSNTNSNDSTVTVESQSQTQSTIHSQDGTWTDQGNAERLLTRHGKDLMYCPEFKRVFVWNGVRWVEDTADIEITRRAVRTMKHILTRAEETDDQDLCDFASLSLNRRGLNAMIDLAKRSRDMRIVKPDELNTNPWLLNVPNGTVDLKAGKLRSHRRDDLITQLCPVEYEPKAKCLGFLKCLNQWMCDRPKMVSFMQRYSGLLLTGDVSPQLFFVHYGEGNNGKSQYFSIMLNLLGRDYATVAPQKLLVIKKSDSHTTDITELYGRRLMVAVESDQGATLNMGMIKWWCSDERLKGRKLFQDNMEWDPTHKLALQTNHKPTVSDTSDGAWRRVRLVPWAFSVPAEDRVDNLYRVLLNEEAKGILAWAVQGAVEYSRGGLSVPDLVLEQTKDYRGEQDVLADFIEDRCEIDADKPNESTSVDRAYQHVTQVKLLYPQYIQWCDTQKIAPWHRLQRQHFNELLRRNYGCYQKTVRVEGGKPVKCWIGVSILGPNPTTYAFPKRETSPETQAMLEKLNKAKDELMGKEVA